MSACGLDLRLGDTTFGNHNVWHGRPDIWIDRSIVKIESELDESVDDEETLEYDTTIEIKKDKEIKNGLEQAFAQTITNAFYQAKENPELKNLFIPSFLATDVKVQILMYNVEEDRLLKSQDMQLFSDQCLNGLNNGTIVCIWFALNFVEKFQQKGLEKEFEAIKFEKSGFQSRLPHDILSIYLNQLKRPLSMSERVKETEKVKGTAYHLWNSAHTKRMKEKLDTLDEKYWKKFHP
ncbi:unnamed protein product [Mytilus edulis]|uniref:Uncharacterized protein n=1 Tax=Mytilus edulis TaxID=6550 RepID=A0A8S3TYB8_MYTED|nr:unnamed protein product [Mytilus edulis]